MTTGTISGDIQVQVTGIGSLYILVIVTTGTGGGGALEAGTVAFKALCSLVCPRQRECSQIMIEYDRGVSRRVTGQTGRTVI